MTKILLVEDDKNLREIYGVRLLAEGYDIVSAGDGEEALAMAIKERPSLIVSDVMMPKISGFDMLDILQSTTETKDIKVIMMTALSGDDQRQRGEQLGAARYLVKSQVGIEDVVRAVHEVLGDDPNISPEPTVAQDSYDDTPDNDSAQDDTDINDIVESIDDQIDTDTDDDLSQNNESTSSFNYEETDTDLNSNIQSVSDDSSPNQEQSSQSNQPPQLEPAAQITRSSAPIIQQSSQEVAGNQSADAMLEQPAEQPSEQLSQAAPQLEQMTQQIEQAVSQFGSEQTAASTDQQPQIKTTPPIQAQPSPAAAAPRVKTGGERVIQPLNGDVRLETNDLANKIAQEVNNPPQPQGQYPPQQM